MRLKNITEIIITPPSTDFVVGEDSFGDLVINDAGEGTFYYFKNTKAGLVKRFVLKRTKLTQKHCGVTLIKKENGGFEPRFDFEIFDLSKKAVASLEVPVTENETRLVKAKVDLSDCHENFSKLLEFICSVENIELDADAYAVIGQDVKEKLGKLLGSIEKETALIEFAQRYGGELTEKDVTLLTGRKKSLEIFKRLLEEPEYFEGCKAKFGIGRDEALWQKFFEDNTWIFGYGLQLVSCESLDDQKLEATVVGRDIIDGGGKRADALLKTRGYINTTIFGEIKTHKTPLMKSYPRPDVFVPSEDLQGAIGQVQKTVHKVSLKIGENFKKIFDGEGNPTGENLAIIRPKALVVVGRLSEFDTGRGVNEEQFASFELYRQQLVGIEILTFDELYERTRFIVGN